MYYLCSRRHDRPRAATERTVPLWVAISFYGGLYALTLVLACLVTP